MRSERTREQICADLEALAHEDAFIYSLATIAWNDLFFDLAEAADINWREQLSFQEITFLAGLMVKHPLRLQKPTAEDLQRQITRAYVLFEELHSTYLRPFVNHMIDIRERVRSDGLSREEGKRELFGSGSAMTEPIFYSDSGAYDFQYRTLAPKRYQNDREWLEAHKGINAEDGASIVHAIKNAREVPQTPPLHDLDAFLDEVLKVFCISAADLPDHNPTDVDAFFKAFSLQPGEVNTTLTEPGQYNRLDSHPLIKLDSGDYFIPVQFNLARSIYESPSYWMLADHSYCDTASAHRGDATEAMTAEMLTAVFGAENVHRGVELRRGRRTVGEIDVLAKLGRKALMVQCKSKRLTEMSRRGDSEQLAVDFAAAVQDAYDQGRDCRKLLRDPAVTAFTADGIPADSDFDDAFIACVVSDHYPSLTHQVHVYLTRESDDPFPIALSVFDLEVICHYLRDPFDLMYYIRQRTGLAEYFHATEEISLLAYHLKHKLYSIPGAGLVTVDPGMAGLFDANYPAARGEHPESEAATRLFHEWKNDHYEQLVRDLKDSGEPSFVDAVFMLFDFSSDAIDGLFAQILEAKRKTTGDGAKHSVAVSDIAAAAGISFVTRASDHVQLGQDNFLYAQRKKYQTRTREWLGLGSLGASERLAEVVVYNRDPWEYDADLEEATRKYLGSGTVKRLIPKVGRNDPCSCGSGIKFKRCHGR